jgi:hypothetical protein
MQMRCRRHGEGVKTRTWPPAPASRLRAVITATSPIVRFGVPRRGQYSRAADNLHAICARSASLLHARELRCYDKAKAARGIGGTVRLRASRRVAAEEQTRANVTRHLK